MRRSVFLVAVVTAAFAISSALPRPVLAAPDPPPFDGFQIINALNHFCLSIDANGYAETRLCSAADSHQWWHWDVLNTSGHGPLVNAGGQCLGVQNASLEPRARIRGGGCNGNDDQHWARSFNGRYEGFPYNILNYHSRMAIGIAAAYPGEHGQIIQNTMRDNKDESWDLRGPTQP